MPETPTTPPTLEQLAASVEAVAKAVSAGKRTGWVQNNNLVGIVGSLIACAAMFRGCAAYQFREAARPLVREVVAEETAPILAAVQSTDRRVTDFLTDRATNTNSVWRAIGDMRHDIRIISERLGAP